MSLWSGYIIVCRAFPLKYDFKLIKAKCPITCLIVFSHNFIYFFVADLLTKLLHRKVDVILGQKSRLVCVKLIEDHLQVLFGRMILYVNSG